MPDENSELRKLKDDLHEAVKVMVNSGCISGHDHPLDICSCGNCYIRRLLKRADAFEAKRSSPEPA